MSDPKRNMSCFGMLLGIFCIVVFALVFLRIADLVLDEPSPPHRHPRSAGDRTGEADGPDFTTMDAQLVLAQEKGQTITQIRLEGTPAPLEGPWTVKEVGYDVVVLQSASGLMTVRMEAIVGILVAPEQPKKIPEPQVEK